MIREGAHTLEAVGLACGAGTDCGGCRGTVDDLLDEVLESLDPSRDTRPARGRGPSLPLAP